MLRKQITGAKYNSEQTGQMTNLNVAIPADSNDTDFGTSDVLLAKDTFKAVENKIADKIIDVAKEGVVTPIIENFQPKGKPFHKDVDIDFMNGDSLIVDMQINNKDTQEQILTIGDRIDVWGAGDNSNATVLHIYFGPSKPYGGYQVNVDYVTNNKVIKQGVFNVAYDDSKDITIPVKITLSKDLFTINDDVISEYDLTNLFALKAIKIGSAFTDEPAKLSTATYNSIIKRSDLIQGNSVDLTGYAKNTDLEKYAKKTDLSKYYVEGEDLVIGDALNSTSNRIELRGKYHTTTINNKEYTISTDECWSNMSYSSFTVTKNGEYVQPYLALTPSGLSNCAQNTHAIEIGTVWDYSNPSSTNSIGNSVTMGFCNDMFQIKCTNKSNGADITGIKSLTAFSNPSANTVWATDGSKVDISALIKRIEQLEAKVKTLEDSNTTA